MNNNENEVIDLNPYETVRVEEKPKREKKSRFGLGLVSGILTMIIVLGILYGLVANSGMSLVIGGNNGVTQVPDSSLLDEESVQKLNEIYSYMYLYYYEDFELADIQEMLYKGAMEGLDDPYSVYYTKAEYEELMINTSGVFVGIGAGLTQDTTTMVVTISKVYKGTPAEEAGLLNGDQIMMVDDIDATSMPLDELVQNIRGEEGTKVHLKIYRESTEEILEIDATRRRVIIPSIEGEMLADGIGYIQITEFQEKTAEQFDAMIEDLNSQGMKGLIVDVRANPGGYVRTATDILDILLPKGLLVYTEDKYGNRQEIKSDASALDIPMVVLIDGNSASASEIFAGAIKDYEWGTLLGTTTYGKGIVQNIIELSDGDAIKLTTSKYFTPNGNYIHGVGIDPDVEIEYEYAGPLDQPYDKQYDNQFLEAVELIKEMLVTE